MARRVVLRGIWRQFCGLTQILRVGELHLERLFVRGWFKFIIGFVVVGQCRGGHKWRPQYGSESVMIVLDYRGCGSVCPEGGTEVARRESAINSFDPLHRVCVQPRQDCHWSWVKRFFRSPLDRWRGACEDCCL